MKSNEYIVKLSSTVYAFVLLFPHLHDGPTTF